MLENANNIEKKIIFDEPMKQHTTFKIGGKADEFIKVESEEELEKVLEYAKSKKIKPTIIGNGSNILVTDKGIRGIVIKIDIEEIKIEKGKEQVTVTVGAGTKIMKLASKLMKEGITGFEELAGIPGTIGGAIYMNAGAYGKEIKDIVESTKCIDTEGKKYEFTNKEQEFSYRSSIFSKKKMEKLLTQRKEKQPIECFSAGSSFKRKEGIITAKLIDECGLKGYKIGGAKISEKHAGFIINEGNATAKDVIDLIKYVKEKVYEKYKIKIEEEIKIIGER